MPHGVGRRTVTRLRGRDAGGDRVSSARRGSVAASPDSTRISARRAARPSSQAVARPAGGASARHGGGPDPQTRDRVLSGEPSSGGHDTVRYPCGKRYGNHLVCTRPRMDFVNCGKPAVRKQIRQANESWPDPSVYKGYFAIDQTARQHIWGIAHRSRQREDAVRLRVRPPVALDGLPGNELDQIGYRALTAFQHHALTLQYREDPIPHRRSRRRDPCH
jgi:hypothetical protein